MSKTIKIPVRYGDYETQYTVDVAGFAADAACSPRRSRWTWLGLTVKNDAGDFVLTPRGEDLLASVDSIPDDPEPESASAKCPACEGTGERVLFVYPHHCDECEGTGIKAGASAAEAEASQSATLLQQTPWLASDIDGAVRSYEAGLMTVTKSRPTKSSVDRLEADLAAFNKAVYDAYHIPYRYMWDM